MQALLVSLMFSLALMAMLFAAWKLFQDAPDDDRSYKDKPPLLFRLFWPLIQLIAGTIEPIFSKATADTYQVLLRRAGQDYALNPLQFYAGKILCVFLGFGFGLLLTNAAGAMHFGCRDSDCCAGLLLPQPVVARDNLCAQFADPQSAAVLHRPFDPVGGGGTEPLWLHAGGRRSQPSRTLDR